MEQDMKPHLALAALVLAAAPAFAQDTMRDAARTYVESIAMQSALDQLLSTDAYIAQVRASGVQLDAEGNRTLTGIVDEEFSDVRPELEEALTAAAADTFTMEELDALNAFYQSEAGQSVAAKMAPFMQGFYESIAPTLRETQEQIAMRARDALAAEETAPGNVTE
jgi:hypothetical protein